MLALERIACSRWSGSSDTIGATSIGFFPFPAVPGGQGSISGNSATSDGAFGG